MSCEFVIALVVDRRRRGPPLSPLLASWGKEALAYEILVYTDFKISFELLLIRVNPCYQRYQW